MALLESRPSHTPDSASRTLGERVSQMKRSSCVCTVIVHLCVCVCTVHPPTFPGALSNIYETALRRKAGQSELRELRRIGYTFCSREAGVNRRERGVCQ